MEERWTKTGGSLIVDRDLALYGTVAGDVTVFGGAHLQSHGTIGGNLVAERGSKVDIHGTVEGAVVNMGGEVVIYGTVGSVTGHHSCRIAAEGAVRT